MPGLVPDIGTLFSLVENETSIGLAVSGGADSLALMLLAQQWAKPRSIRVHVYSVDHGMRPEASDEVAFVLREAKRLGLAARGPRWNGPHPATGVQAAARAVRYRLIADAMAEDGVGVLLTAHHMDDQAETVLMRMAHGSGIEGLRGMLASSRGEEGLWIVRPLLGVPKAELERIVAEAGLTAVADPSNDDTRYERVRWRNMMPRLAELGLDAERLAKLASRAAEASEAIDSAAAAIVANHGSVPITGITLPLRGLTDVPRAVGVRALGRALGLVGKARKSRDLAAIEQLFARLAAGAPVKPLTLHGCVVASDGLSVSIAPEGPRKATLKSRKRETAN